ncbi:hypothetical protein M231_07554 [Tremella mesenterica]|uniref:Uncharacterized protein n=1 Tax=Tremella mesenterica TaxID=5217 RepID=A0A4Q1BFQ8_TREME|nr:hypothetical protein M231_07554 [Tremella mesenterica]
MFSFKHLSLVPLTRDTHTFKRVHIVLPLLITRTITSSSVRRTQTGYGDPQDEKIENNTPLPTHSRTDHEVSSSSSQGTSDSEKASDFKKGVREGDEGGEKKGKGKDGGKSKNKKNEEMVKKETKKVGEEPKKTKVGGAGPIGG